MYGVPLDVDSILTKVSEYNIFSYYLGTTDIIGNLITSPLRKDEWPSFTIFKTLPNSGKSTLMYRDFATGDVGNCFQFVRKLFNCNHPESLRIIDNDFRLGIVKKEYIKASLNLFGLPDKKQLPPLDKKVIQVKRRSWNTTVDKDFWSKYHITCALLNEYNIVPVTHLWVDTELIWFENYKNPIYVYCFPSNTYKAYRPYNSKSGKWLGNVSAKAYQGFEQLPWVGDNLIITKSLKDVIVLRVLGYNAIATQSENTEIPEETMSGLIHRFTNVTVFYDNDTAGIDGAKKLCRKHNVNGIIIPLEYEVKDISDFVAKYSLKEAEDLLKQLLWR